jgi:ribonucleoside-triphosphate reductase
VYARIVGYYRAVRNWNKGKKSEKKQRVAFIPKI